MRSRDHDRRAKAAQVLDAMLEFFGEDGARWLQTGYQNYRGQRCLIGALDHARHTLGIRSYAARDFLIAALPGAGTSLLSYNDHCPNFAHLRALIVTARALALEQAIEPTPLRLAA